MKILEIYEYLNTLSPFEIQESWDNSGLLIGDFKDDISKIALSIDVDEKLIDSLDDNTLLITHHPIIFGSVLLILGFMVAYQVYRVRVLGKFYRGRD